MLEACDEKPKNILKVHFLFKDFLVITTINSSNFCNYHLISFFFSKLPP